MNNLFRWTKETFLTKKFITFGIIGVINTLIHMAVYFVFYQKMAAGTFWSNTIAFLSASAFSYFANAVFTFKAENKSAFQFSAVMVVFFVRLWMSNGLTAGFDAFFRRVAGLDYDAVPLASVLAPFFGSALLVPLAYFALDYVFKWTDRHLRENPDASIAILTFMNIFWHLTIYYVFHIVAGFSLYLANVLAFSIAALLSFLPMTVYFFIGRYPHWPRYGSAILTAFIGLLVVSTGLVWFFDSLVFASVGSEGSWHRLLAPFIGTSFLLAGVIGFYGKVRLPDKKETND